MSNNFLSQQLSLLNEELGQMESSFSGLNSSTSNIGMGMTGHMSHGPGSQQLAISDQQTLPVSSKQIGQMGPNTSIRGSQQFLNQHVGQMGAMSNMGAQKLLLPSKRSASESMSSNYVTPQLSIPNRRVSEMDSFLNSPGSQQRSAPIKKTGQIQSISSPTGLQNLSAPNKKMARNESMSGRSGSVQTPKSRSAQVVPSPKAQTESFESVRSKMRESLAAALALVSQPRETANEENNSQSEAASNPQQKQDNSTPESTSIADTSVHGAEDRMETFPSGESCQPNDGLSTPQETSAKDKMADHVRVQKFEGQEFLYNGILQDEGATTFSDNFFVNDELLQGNGLSWALDPIMEVEEAKEFQTAKKAKLVHEDVSGDTGEQEVRTPENLAFKIEAELFKLFGGVNKKYKEKGRSLLFNLKDRSNPELRENVMSGKISPERLCSMTAEELASKELSEWRMAKAEELAQMVVLPDSDVDIRRLVRKTHKGEFQVEVEEDDGGVSMDVGTSVITPPSKKKEMEAQTASKSDGNKENEDVREEKGSSGNHDVSSSLTIPSDGSDLMQGLMVDEFNEFKDAEFLPPIVSLDEFMESLDSEPPFENLPLDARRSTSPLAKEKSEDKNELDASGTPPKASIKMTPDKVDKKEKTEKIAARRTPVDVKVKSSQSPVARPRTSPSGGRTEGERIWGGVLQLTISSAVTAVGFLRSGEKTSTKEWPSSLEIKGRVRLDAFEKFIQDLRMSRSRAVMITQFVLKEGSSEDDRASLSEVVDSYILDERLGFAEPAPGMEIYFCPHHTKMLEILVKHLPNNYTETLKSSDNNSLIGVIVWRKAHLTSTISPNSSSHHKKQHLSSTRRNQERDTNANANVNHVPKQSILGKPPSQPQPQIDDDDDIPPRFGPPAARDDDDLPEFNFSNPSVAPKFGTRNQGPNSNIAPFKPHLHTPPPSVDHVRSLINKYGQNENNVMSRNSVGTKRWIDDDDDDMPEWQPQLPQPPPMHGYQQPLLATQAVNQHAMLQTGYGQAPRMPMMPLQRPTNNAIQGGFWPQQSAPQSNLGNQPSGGQFQGMPLLRHDAPRSRGF